MKFGGRLFGIGTVFYFVVGAVYWFMSKDPIGTTVISLTGGLAFLISFYSLFTINRVGELPEDNEDGEIEHADSEYGFFSPHSWWPLAIGVSAFMFVLGFVFAGWLALLGVVTLLFTVFGLVFEYYSGEFAS